MAAWLAGWLLGFLAVSLCTVIIRLDYTTITSTRNLILLGCHLLMSGELCFLIKTCRASMVSSTSLLKGCADQTSRNPFRGESTPSRVNGKSFKLKHGGMSDPYLEVGS